MTPTADRVKDIIISTLALPDKDLYEDADLHSHLGANSLDIVELIMECEAEWDIAITDEQAEKIQTVGDLIKAVQAHLPEVV